MKASFVDLRKKSNEIIKALNRQERITIMYRGKPKAVMHTIGESNDNKDLDCKNFDAFGMWKSRKNTQNVDKYVRNLRKGRFDAV